MKISTANEMAIAVPDSDSLEAMKQAIPNPSQFPYPTPDIVRSAFDDWEYLNSAKLPATTKQFMTGKKEKGQGMSISSYPTLYINAIVPLQKLWELRDNTDAMIQYLLDNPIQYKSNRNPEDAKYSDGSINKQEWISRCLSNLLEWLYLPSNPVYQYLREHLLEKARKIRLIYKDLAFDNKYYVQVLPQRPTTSRSLGADETPLAVVNAGYRPVSTYDPYTNQKEDILELVTWFYTNAHTEKKLYVDYIDIEDGNVDKAIRQMRRSPLYYYWARKASPAEYDKYCALYRLDDEGMNLDDLTFL